VAPLTAGRQRASRKKGHVWGLVLRVDEASGNSGLDKRAYARRAPSDNERKQGTALTDFRSVEENEVSFA